MTAIMSMREPFPRGGIWYYELDRKRLSLRTKDRAEAMRLFKAIQREYLDGKISRLNGSCSKRLGDFVAEVLELMETTAPANSFRSMRSATIRLLAVVGSSTRLDRLTPKHWDLFVLACKRDKLAAKSIRTYQLCVRSLMAKAVGWGMLPEDPWRKCKLAREEIRLPVFLELDQIDALFASIKDADVELLVRLCIFTGRRIGEVVALEWQKLDLDGLKYQAWSPKTRRWQTYPMHAALADALRPVRQDIGYVVPRWRSANTAGRAVKNALRAAGFGNLRPHDLRHTFASMVVLAGNDLKIAQELLGHGSYKSTLRYAHLTPSAVAAGLARVQFAYSAGGKPIKSTQD